MYDALVSEMMIDVKFVRYTHFIVILKNRTGVLLTRSVNTFVIWYDCFNTIQPKTIEKANNNYDIYDSVLQSESIYKTKLSIFSVNEIIQLFNFSFSKSLVEIKLNR